MSWQIQTYKYIIYVYILQGISEGREDVTKFFCAFTIFYWHIIASALWTLILVKKWKVDMINDNTLQMLLLLTWLSTSLLNYDDSNNIFTLYITFSTFI